ncbi:mitochondrial oxaloacetate transport protein [Histoplasma mississippiense (nom. inval.)]|uniref:mitochondrial oxaloacetate transport protein n=1 Tax=Ajellomyces capsulatus (strain NAm1 / WU24) TaxID=2059318 RepID=UPI000157BE08|nr:mitochondrial oxaloacetate transport protein [Histoplasma mississippiense (nom. inval.)]EDN05982.1 mitochondrial oxaloacetate transport protein [Histoplasma mississippiense (nom. inval.)]
MSTTAGAFIAGGLAACGAVTVTHSFETVKIRCKENFSRSGKQCANTGAFSTASKSFSKTKELGASSEVSDQQGCIGCLGAARICFFLVKTRLQSFSPFLPVGTQHKYRNSFDGLRQIYMGEGVKGLYRGVYAAMVRTGFGSSVQLPTYFFAKRRLIKHLGMEDGPALHLASSTCSGFVVCCVMHPPDTIMSRMYNQTGNLYKGVFDCLYKTISTEGVLAIYKGYFAHLARILPHTILTLSLAEQTNKLLRRVEDRIIPDSIREKI